MYNVVSSSVQGSTCSEKRKCCNEECECGNRCECTERNNCKNKESEIDNKLTMTYDLIRDVEKNGIDENGYKYMEENINKIREMGERMNEMMKDEQNIKERMDKIETQVSMIADLLHRVATTLRVRV